MPSATNPVRELARDLARRSDEITTAAVTEAVRHDPGNRLAAYWVDAEILDNDGNPAWVASTVFDYIDRSDAGNADPREVQSQLLLRALANEQYAVAGRILADAMRRAIAADVERQVRTERFVLGFLEPLRGAIDHFDAIGADRRALSHEHNRGLA
jgi:hypothetical protein